MDVHRRQGHHPRAAQLRRPRLAGRADRDHRRRRQHHDPQPADLRPGRDPLPSVGDEGNEGGAEPGRAGRAGGIRPQPVRPHRLRDLQRGALVLVRPDRREDRHGAGRRLHPPLLPQARPLFGQPRADGRRVDAAARRQAEVQGIAVRPPRRRAQPALHRPARMLKRYQDEGAPVGDQPLLAWAFHDSVHKIETGAVRRAAQLPDPSGRLAAVGAGVPVGPPRAGAERPPRPSRRRAADDAERSARPPGRRRVPDPVREQSRPAASTATWPRRSWPSRWNASSSRR